MSISRACPTALIVASDYLAKDAKFGRQIGPGHTICNEYKDVLDASEKITGMTGMQNSLLGGTPVKELDERRRKPCPHLDRVLVRQSKTK